MNDGWHGRVSNPEHFSCNFTGRAIWKWPRSDIEICSLRLLPVAVKKPQFIRGLLVLKTHVPSDRIQTGKKLIFSNRRGNPTRLNVEPKDKGIRRRHLLKNCWGANARSQLRWRVWLDKRVYRYS